MAKKNAIRCPHCGREYLPGEIFYPKDFLGQPKNVINDHEGNVIDYEGSDMNLKETFVCESCNTNFEVDATITFKTGLVRDLFADDDFVSKIEG